MGTVVCNCCYGGKEILGKGMFYISCPKCNGVGHVFIEDKKDINEDIVCKKNNDDALESPIFKKSTRGRKKKVDKL